jgi:hypothetical protein
MSLTAQTIRTILLTAAVCLVFVAAGSKATTQVAEQQDKDAYLCGSPRLCGNDSRKAYKPQSRRGIAEIRREHIRHGQHVLPPSMLLM